MDTVLIIVAIIIVILAVWIPIGIMLNEKKEGPKYSPIEPYGPNYVGEGNKLHCPSCRTSYKIGENAFITTMKQAIATLGGVGVNQMGNKNPDMVGTINLDPPELQRAQAKAKNTWEMVKKDLQKGINRTWYCGKCMNHDKPFSYPSI